MKFSHSYRLGTIRMMIRDLMTMIFAELNEIHEGKEKQT